MAGTADRWLAILAGRNTWQDSERPLTVTMRVAGGVQVLALLLSVTALLAHAHGTDRDSLSPIERAAPLILCLVAVATCVGPTRTLLGKVLPSRSLWLNVAVRALLGIGLTIGIYGVAPGWAALFSWPVGVAMGCDAALTSCAIGWRPSPLQWWVSFVLSPVHLGVVGGLVGSSISGSNASTLDVLLPIYITTHVWVAVACTTAWSSRRILDTEAAALDAVRTETVGDEHRRSAHWLHDDICAQLRQVTLKVQSGAVALDEVVMMLDELDFALRLRQLDELLHSGAVRLAELLQPFLRNAQNHGIAVERVPSYETASTVVDHHAGHNFRHAAAVLTSNALNAGATRLSVDVEVEHRHIQLSITDDAGGFDPAHICVGRGLWSLQHDLGAGNLTIQRLDNGSKVIATVPTGTRSADGTSLAR